MDTTMSTTTQQTLSFLQRRLQAIELDIQHIIVMYLKAQSTKNGELIQQCEITLRSAREHQYIATQAIKGYNNSTTI